MKEPQYDTIERHNSKSSKTIIIPLAKETSEESIDSMMQTELMSPPSFNTIIAALKYIFHHIPHVRCVEGASDRSDLLTIIKFLKNTDFNQLRYTILFLPQLDSNVGYPILLGLIVDSKTKSIIVLKTHDTCNRSKSTINLSSIYVRKSEEIYYYISFGNLIKKYLRGYKISHKYTYRNIHPLVRHTGVEFITAVGYRITSSSQDIILHSLAMSETTLELNYSYRRLRELIFLAAKAYKQLETIVNIGSNSIENRALAVLANAPIQYFKQALTTPLSTTMSTDDAWRAYYQSIFVTKLSTELITQKQKSMCQQHHETVLQLAIDSNPIKFKSETKPLLVKIWLQLRALCYLNDFKQVQQYLQLLKNNDLLEDVLLMHYPSNGFLLLHQLFLNNQIEILAEIIACFPIYFFTIRDDIFNATPLDLATYAGHLDIVKNNIYPDITIEDKCQLLHRAAQGEQQETFHWLLHNVIYKKSKKVKYLPQTNRVEILGSILLTNWRFVKMLLDFFIECDINASGRIQKKSKHANRRLLTTALYELIRTKYSDAHVIQLLLAYGAYPLASSTHSSKKLYAILQSSDADNKATQTNKTNVLSLAIRHGRIQEIYLLLKYYGVRSVRTLDKLVDCALADNQIGFVAGSETEKNNFIKGMLTFLEWYAMASNNKTFSGFNKILTLILSTDTKLLLNFISDYLYHSRLSNGEMVESLFTHEKIPILNKDHKNFDKLYLRFKIHSLNQTEKRVSPAEIFAKRMTANFLKFFVAMHSQYTSLCPSETARPITENSKKLFKFIASSIARELWLLSMNHSVDDYNTDEHLLAICFANYGFTNIRDITVKFRLYYHSYFRLQNPQLTEHYQIYDRVQGAQQINIDYFLNKRPSTDTDAKDKYYEITKNFQRYLNCHLLAMEKQIQLCYPDNYVLGVIDITPNTLESIIVDLCALVDFKTNYRLLHIWDETKQTYLNIIEYMKSIIAEHFLNLILRYESNNLLTMQKSNLLDLTNEHDIYIPLIKKYGLTPVIILNITKRGDVQALENLLSSKLTDLTTLYEPFKLGAITHPPVLTIVVDDVLSNYNEINYAKKLYIFKKYIKNFKQTVFHAYELTGKCFSKQNWNKIKESLHEVFNSMLNLALDKNNFVEFYNLLQSPHPFKLKHVNDEVLYQAINKVEDKDSTKLFAALDQHKVNFDGHPKGRTPLVSAICISKPSMLTALLARISNPNAPKLVPNHSTDIERLGESPLIRSITWQNEVATRILLADPRININYQDIGGNTAIKEAISMCQPKIVKLLLSKGAITQPDKYGDTILHHLAIQIINKDQVDDRRELFNVLIKHEQQHPGALCINKPNNNDIIPILVFCETAYNTAKHIPKYGPSAKEFSVIKSIYEDEIVTLVYIIDDAEKLQNVTINNSMNILYFATSMGWHKLLKRLLANPHINVAGIYSEPYDIKKSALSSHILTDKDKKLISKSYINKLKLILRCHDTTPIQKAAAIRTLLPLFIEEIMNDLNLIQTIIKFTKNNSHQFEEMNQCLYEPGFNFHAKQLEINIHQRILLSNNIKLFNSICLTSSDSDIALAIFEMCTKGRVLLTKLGKPAIVYLASLIPTKRFANILTKPLPAVQNKTILQKLASCINFHNIVDLYSALRVIGEPIADTMIKYDLITVIKNTFVIKKVRKNKNKSATGDLSLLQSCLFKLLYLAIKDKDIVEPNQFAKLFAYPLSRDALLSVEKLTGDTILHILFKNNLSPVNDNHLLNWVEFLIQQGLKLNQVNNGCQTPLDIAILLNQNMPVISKLNELLHQSELYILPSNTGKQPTNSHDSLTMFTDCNKSPSDNSPFKFTLFEAPSDNNESYSPPHPRQNSRQEPRVGNRQSSNSTTKQDAIEVTSKSQAPQPIISDETFTFLPLSQMTDNALSSNTSNSSTLTNLAMTLDFPIPQFNLNLAETDNNDTSIPTINNSLSQDIFIFGADNQEDDQSEKPEDSASNNCKPGN